MEMNRTEKVGVLLVHGIGEQSQFEHLEATVHSIALAIRETLGIDEEPRNDLEKSVRVVVRTALDSAYASQQVTWRAENEAPVYIEIKTTDKNNKKVTEIHFNEVWWADLDEPTNVKTSLLFWWWGLSLWGKKWEKESHLEGSDRMRSPENIDKGEIPRLNWLVRLRLMWVSLVIFLILPFLFLVGQIVRRFLGFNLPLDIISQYVGDVKLYQQEERIVKGSLPDIGYPPRVTIRRRMVQALVKMAMRDYDRWYILAHSQGTVLALNGLTEIEQALPNYLSKELWENNKNKIHSQAQKPSPKVMMPTRPAWLNDEDAISRQKLFSHLKGFMTYGSPLRKFAVLWPKIVPINKDECVFPQDFEWLNIYDPTDPVADKLKYFDSKLKCSQDYQALAPRNHAYKAASFHLLSHTAYLHFKPHSPDLLVNRVADWLLDNQEFKIGEKKSKWRWPGERLEGVYSLLRVITWLVIGFTIAILINVFASITWGLVTEGISSLNWQFDITKAVIRGAKIVLSAAGIVIVAGGLRLLWNLASDRKQDKTKRCASESD